MCVSVGWNASEPSTAAREREVAEDGTLVDDLTKVGIGIGRTGFGRTIPDDRVGRLNPAALKSATGDRAVEGVAIVPERERGISSLGGGGGGGKRAKGAEAGSRCEKSIESTPLDPRLCADGVEKVCEEDVGVGEDSGVAAKSPEAMARSSQLSATVSIWR